MSIFKISDKKLIPIKEKTIDLERDIQKVTEKNIETIFGLIFISSEFSLQNMRLDTLAFNEETKSFVIIEYKKDRSFSVIDQGYAYLSLMLNNKAEFILEYNEKINKKINRNDIDWSQSKVIFIANSFTQYQRNAIQFKDIPFELWEVKKYDNDTISYNKLINISASESINIISKDKTIEKVNREIKEYTEKDLITKGTIGERLFNVLKEKIYTINPVLITNPRKFYIAFRFPEDRKNIFAVWVQKEKLFIDFLRIRPKDLKDPEKKLKYRKDSFKNYNVHISRIEVKNEKELKYAFYLLYQLYEIFIKDFKSGNL